MITVCKRSNYWTISEKNFRERRRRRRRGRGGGGEGGGSEKLTDARNCALTANRVIFEAHISEKETAGELGKLPHRLRFSLA
jgi:hypothetical protein